MRETAGVDQHTKPRADAAWLAVLQHDDAFDSAVFHHQFLDRRLGAKFHPGLDGSLQHPPLQRPAGGDEVLAGQFREGCAQDHLDRQLLRFP